eukprot:Gb_28988 [translate_table: standard]
MTPSWIQNANGSSITSASTSTSTSSQSLFSQFLPSTCAKHTGVNVLKLLAWREISPRIKRPSKRLWGEAARWSVDCSGPRCEVTDAKHGLIAWVEAESLRHFSAKYCPLVPPPRSTIAAAFSPDGRTLASTHGDHTVKIIYCRTGTCLKVLSGHRRTPWVVRFHPSRPEIIASGSLDHEVRLWDANTAECIGSRDFYRPIASIAFHAQGDLLAVASGHKLYIWQYKKGDASAPMIVLRTRRSLRAVHFHPHAAPLLLTAEVNDLDSPDSPMTLATSPGYLQYPPPAVFFTPVRPNTGSRNSVSGVNSAPLMPFPCLFWPAAFVNENDVRSSQADGMLVETANLGQPEAENVPSSQNVVDLDMETQTTTWAAPMDVSPQMSSGGPLPELLTSGRNSENAVIESQLNETVNSIYGSGVDTLSATDGQPLHCDRHRVSPDIVQELEDAELSNQNLISARTQLGTTSFRGESSSRLPGRQARQVPGMNPGLWPSNISTNVNLQLLLGSGATTQLHQFLPVGDHAGWELPFLQGWLMGQTQAGLSPNLPTVEGSQNGMFGMPTMSSDIWASESHQQQQNHGVSLLSSTMAGIAAARVAGRSGGRHRSRSRLSTQAGTGLVGTFTGDGVGTNIANEDRDPQHNLGAAEAEAVAAQATMAAAAAAAAAELPCTVKLRIWPHNIKEPSALLDPETCRLTIPHAVLCSEMGAHFSPCGRFLAACVACVLPQQELEAGLQSQSNQGAGGTATSPTRHPISAQQVVYELRIYSLEETTFGEVLASRAIRAAHCLTSIQFSPTSAHILLAYGRRHNSLLRSIVVDGTTTIPIYTILEIYKVSDMELVRVLPSAEDEVNVACFHPLVGGGLVYGTKEGKLRILQYDRTHSPNHPGPGSGMEHNLFEVG